MNDVRPEDQAPDSAAEFTIVEAAVAAEDATPLPSPAKPAPVVVNAAMWTAGGFAVMQVARFGANVLLTRLVEKPVFGIITTANIWLQGLHMFSDLGVRQCVVNSARGDDPAFLNTAWTVQVIRGLVLWASAFALCAPVAWIYEEPMFLWLVPLLGSSAVFDGLTATAAMTMSRQLRRDRIVIREIAAYGVSLVVMLAWLWTLRLTASPGDRPDGPQLLAFAGGSLACSFLEMALSYTFIPGQRNRFHWDPTAARELLHFGGWIFISTACTFLAANLDRLYVSKLSRETLADYHIASQLARLPTLLIAALGHQLVFPMYSRLLRQGTTLEESLPAIHVAMTGFAGWLIAGAFAACPTLIHLLYPPKYAAAADYIGWLAVGAWFTILQTSSEVVLLAQGRTRQMAIGQIVKLVTLIPLLLVGDAVDGIRGVTIGYAIAEALRYAVLAAALTRQGLPVVRLDVGLTVLVLGTALAAQWIGPQFEADSATAFGRWAPRFLAEGITVTVLWAGILAAWWPGAGARFLAIVRRPG